MAISNLFELAFSPLVLVPVFVYFAYVFYKQVNADEIPKTIPWIRGNESWIGKLKANAGEIEHAREYLYDGHYKYSVFGKPYVLPRLTCQPWVVLPPETVHWLSGLSDEVVVSKELQFETLSLYYTQTTGCLADESLSWMNYFHEDHIKRDLTRQLGNLLPDIVDELHTSITDAWGTDTENFIEVNPFEDLMTVITRTTNRMFVGLPLCRNRDFLQSAKDYANAMGQYGILASSISPVILRPIISRLVCLPVRLAGRRFDKHMIPVVKERLADVRARLADPEKYAKVRERNDFLQWMVHGSMGQDALQQTPEALSTRMSVVNFAAIHTSTFGITNAIFDISSGPNATTFWQGIRDEAESVLGEANGVWNRQALGKMLVTDSAIRESLRVTGFGSIAFTRKVVAKEGLTLPSGENVPYGTILAVAGAPTHHDERYYKNAKEYNAFRFAQARTAAATELESLNVGACSDGGDKEKKKDLKDVLEKKNLGMVTPGESFLAFGHGRHACPGRFFAAQELKVLIAFIAMHYEIEPLPVRPENTHISMASLPPRTATIRVRRRRV